MDLVTAKTVQTGVLGWLAGAGLSGAFAVDDAVRARAAAVAAASGDSTVGASVERGARARALLGAVAAAGSEGWRTARTLGVGVGVMGFVALRSASDGSACYSAQRDPFAVWLGVAAAAWVSQLDDAASAAGAKGGRTAGAGSAVMGGGKGDAAGSLLSARPRRPRSNDALLSTPASAASPEVSRTGQSAAQRLMLWTASPGAHRAGASIVVASVITATMRHYV